MLSYWVPLRDVAQITSSRGNQAVFLAAMMAIALPFIWVGVVMTIKRLRSAQLPSPLVILILWAPCELAVFSLALPCARTQRPVNGATNIKVFHSNRSRQRAG
jgi:hypothetical protein